MKVNIFIPSDPNITEQAQSNKAPDRVQFQIGYEHRDSFDLPTWSPKAALEMVVDKINDKTKAIKPGDMVEFRGSYYVRLKEDWRRLPPSYGELITGE